MSDDLDEILNRVNQAHQAQKQDLQEKRLIANREILNIISRCIEKGDLRFGQALDALELDGIPFYEEPMTTLVKLRDTLEKYGIII